jgi:hypothetical protein
LGDLILYVINEISRVITTKMVNIDKLENISGNNPISVSLKIKFCNSDPIRMPRENALKSKEFVQNEISN